MLEKLIEQHEELHGHYVYAITMRADKLCIVPCEATMSGDYPIYNKAVPISERVILSFSNKVNEQIIDAILIRNYNNKLEILFAEDSWDGFQPIES